MVSAEIYQSEMQLTIHGAKMIWSQISDQAI